MLRKAKKNCVINFRGVVTDEPHLLIGSRVLSAKCGVLSTWRGFVDPVDELPRSPTIARKPSGIALD